MWRKRKMRNVDETISLFLELHKLWLFQWQYLFPNDVHLQHIASCRSMSWYARFISCLCQVYVKDKLIRNVRSGSMPKAEAFKCNRSLIKVVKGSFYNFTCLVRLKIKENLDVWFELHEIPSLNLLKIWNDSSVNPGWARNCHPQNNFSFLPSHSKITMNENISIGL